MKVPQFASEAIPGPAPHWNQNKRCPTSATLPLAPRLRGAYILWVLDRGIVMWIVLICAAMVSLGGLGILFACEDK
jgi:hypothetical protein